MTSCSADVEVEKLKDWNLKCQDLNNSELAIKYKFQIDLLNFRLDSE